MGRFMIFSGERQVIQNLAVLPSVPCRAPSKIINITINIEYRAIFLIYRIFHIFPDDVIHKFGHKTSNAENWKTDDPILKSGESGLKHKILTYNLNYS